MTRVVELEPSGFVRVLSDLWTTRNWQTKVQSRGEGRYLIQGRRGDGTRGMLLAIASPDATVQRDHVRGFVAHAKKRGADVVVVATQGEFTEEVRGFATNNEVALLDRDALGETIAEVGLEESVRQYTDGEVYEAAEVEFGLPFDLPEPIANAVASLPVDRVRGLLSGGDGGGGAGADGGAVSLRDRLPSVERLKSGSPPSVRVVVVAVLLLVLALGSVAVLGPMVDGLGGGGGGGGAVAVSALSTAPPSSAALVVRWNARTTDALSVGGESYTAPDGERFVVVALNVTPPGPSPGSLPQSALVFESDGVRYGHQPLANATGFDQGGLFAPNESRVVWTVFSVPTNATTGTVVVREGAEDGVGFVHDPSLPVAPGAER